MNTTVSFRHMDSSPALRDYATRKLERVVDKYVHGRVDSTVVMSVEKFRHIAKFTVQIKNLTVKGDSSSEDMYSSVDLALDKIERQLRRHKERLRDHKPHSGSDAGKPFRMSVVTPPGAEDASYDEEFEEDYKNYPAGEGAEAAPATEAPATEEAASSEDTVNVQTKSGSTGEVKRQQDYEATLLTVEEAALQLDLLEDREFYVFTNAETKSINIIHRRADGTFGLIET